MGTVFSNDLDRILGSDRQAFLDFVEQQELEYLETLEPQPTETPEFMEQLDAMLNANGWGEPAVLLPQYMVPGPPTLDFIKMQVVWDYLAINVSARENPAAVFAQWTPGLPFQLPPPPGGNPFNHVANGSGTLNKTVKFDVFAGGQESGIYNESAVQTFHRHYMVTNATPPPTVTVSIASVARKVDILANIVTKIPLGSEVSAELTGRFRINSGTPGVKDPDITVRDSQGRFLATTNSKQFYDDWVLSFSAPNRIGNHTLKQTLPVSGKSYTFPLTANTKYNISWFLELRVKSRGDWNAIWLKYEDDPKLMI